ncbi:MAG: DUF4198 domain-containing protein [Steroidobacteraceae bacterium]
MLTNRHWTRLTALLSGLMAGLGPMIAGGHEFWVEPANFAPEHGGPVAVRLCIGNGLEGWSMARNSQRIEKFVAAGPSGEQPVVGMHGADPAGIVRLATPGGYVIAYRSNRAFTKSRPAEFAAYLKEKGLENIIALQGAQKAGDGMVREAYSRHSKVLLRMGAAPDAVVDRAMGLGLELVAEPGLLRARATNDPRSFLLLYQGKPLAGALLIASRPGTDVDELHARTDADGRARFRFGAAGMWRIASVHMIGKSSGVDADWESLWTSLTFEMPSGTDPGRQAAAVADRKPCRNRVAATAVQLRR